MMHYDNILKILSDLAKALKDLNDQENNDTKDKLFWKNFVVFLKKTKKLCQSAMLLLSRKKCHSKTTVHRARDCFSKDCPQILFLFGWRQLQIGKVIDFIFIKNINFDF